jgi:hypothetical protein
MEVEEPMHAYQKKFYTIQEYLDMENAAFANMNIIRGRFLPCQEQVTGTILFQQMLLFYLLNY